MWPIITNWPQKDCMTEMAQIGHSLSTNNDLWPFWCRILATCSVVFRLRILVLLPTLHMIWFNACSKSCMSVCIGEWAETTAAEESGGKTTTAWTADLSQTKPTSWRFVLLPNVLFVLHYTQQIRISHKVNLCIKVLTKHVTCFRHRVLPFITPPR